MDSHIQPLTGPCVWSKDALATDGTWVYPLSGGELDELGEALAHAKSLDIAWDQLTRETFPIPHLAGTLTSIRDQLENGLGLAKLTGLPVADFDLEDLRTVWMGIGLHLGTPRFQDRRGQLMRDICNEGGDLGGRHGKLENGGNEFLSSTARTYSSGELRFHTDRVDVVGLLMVSQAERGGISRIASTPRIHNVMLEHHPELVRLLYEPYYRSRLGEEEGGDEVVYPLPVFGVRENKFTSHYSRTYVEAAQLLDSTPPMTEQQWRALDVLAQTAAECSHEMMLEPGDMQLLNNHVIYHARTAFEDSIEHKRLLLRLWLSMPNSRALPEDHAVLWREVESGALRGGIGQQGVA